MHTLASSTVCIQYSPSGSTLCNSTLARVESSSMHISTMHTTMHTVQVYACTYVCILYSTLVPTHNPQPIIYYYFFSQG